MFLYSICLSPQSIPLVKWPYGRPVSLGYIAMQGVGLPGGLRLDVVGQGGVVVQGEPVVLVADQRLGLLGVGHLQHVHGQVVLGQPLGGLLLVLDLYQQCSRGGNGDTSSAARLHEC